jgi:hypothetical protein
MSAISLKMFLIVLTDRLKLVNCKIVFLDFVCHLYFNKFTFWKLDLLPSSGKKERTEILAVGPPG